MATIALLSIAAKVRICFSVTAKTTGVVELKCLIKVAAATNCLGMFAGERKISFIMVEGQ